MRFLACVIALAAAAGQTSYRSEIESWRQRAERSLTSDEGWLTVTGLFWLKEGANRFGTDPSNEIVLPAGSAPAKAGVFEFAGGKIVLRAGAGVAATVNGKPASIRGLRPDNDGSPDVVGLGRLKMLVIRRGDRFGIRLKDADSRFRRQFTGRKWFPVKEAWRIEARWVPYDPPKEIPVLNVVGITEKQRCPGQAVFSAGGRTVRLEPLNEAGQLFFIFKDRTSGKETYPAGRFLYAAVPKDGKVALDFNRAYNPPCAFTPYATCPLPPRQNSLPVRIEAGELTYHAE